MTWPEATQNNIAGASPEQQWLWGYFNAVSAMLLVTYGVRATCSVLSLEQAAGCVVCEECSWLSAQVLLSSWRCISRHLSKTDRHSC